VNPDDGEWSVAAAFDMDGGRPGGIHITNLFDPYNWVFIGLVQSPDRFGVWHLGQRRDWLTIEPVEGVVEAGGRSELTVTLSSVGMPDGTDMEAGLQFSHDGRGGGFEMPVSLSVTGEGQAQRILNLGIGWSLVSVNVDPALDDIVELLSPLVEEGLLIMVKDGAGHFYRPSNDFNNIDGWVGLAGYQFKMSGRGTLRIDGEAIPWDGEIGLSEGWNMVSYLPRVAVDAVDALSGIVEDLEIAKDGWGNFYIPSWDFSNMGLMREGSGYLLKVDGDVNLVYSLGGGRLPGAGAVRGDIDDLNWISGQPRSGVSYSLLLLTEGLPPGTRLEAHSPSGFVAGRGVVGDDGRCGMALWGGESPPFQRSSGFFDEGDELLIVAVGPGGHPQALEGGHSCPSGGGLAQAGVFELPGLEWLDGGRVWRADGWGVARLVCGDALPVSFGLQRVYPNPFNGSLRVDFALGSAGFTTLKVYDLSGRLVETLVSGRRGSGIHTVAWDAPNLASGMYLVRLSSGELTHLKKVLLIK